MQMSSRNARRTSPKPGALTTHTSKTPRFLFSTRPEAASPTRSDAMISSGSLDATTPSRMGRSSAIVLIRSSVTSTRGFTSVATCVSKSLTKLLLSHPTSCSIPSVNSMESVSSRPISTVVDPSTPTLKTASAVVVPMSSEPLEMEAMNLNCSYSVTGVAAFRILSTKKAAVLTSPRWSATELWPFETSRKPARTMACVSTVEVVVPSPALESV
mmetsp:Transcript_7294/g.16310  ORF Transcript_7294/g.16310 Transcript_7294/m.16310 type:complete len:214 (-) Transcript_7294:387-1028(-)